MHFAVESYLSFFHVVRFVGEDGLRAFVHERGEPCQSDVLLESNDFIICGKKKREKSLLMFDLLIIIVTVGYKQASSSK